jgi:hypothetical protein
MGDVFAVRITRFHEGLSRSGKLFDYDSIDSGKRLLGMLLCRNRGGGPTSMSIARANLQVQRLSE